MTEETWYRAEVRSRTRLSPHLVRVRLGAPAVPVSGEPGLHELVADVPDERLVLELPGSPPTTRSYTVRARDRAAGTLDLHVVLHPGGVVAEWAEHVEPGVQVRLSDPRGWYAPPADASWQLLAADLTGLPALARIAETTAAALPTSAVVEVPEPADAQPLAASVDVRWLVGGNGVGASGLPAALMAHELPAGPGYVWFAGEAADARAVRRHLRELGWPVRRYRVLGYWRTDQDAWQRRFTASAPGLEHVYTEAVARGLTSEEALELYDDALADLGL